MRRRLAEDGPREARADGDFDRVSVPDGDGDVLRDILLGEDARVVIEIGLAYGSSALAIAEGTRLRAYRLPNPKVGPSFECFEPFGLDSSS